MDLQLYTNYIIELICKAFKNEFLDEIPSVIDIGELYKHAKFHNIANIIYVPLSKLELDDSSVLEAFKRIHQVKMMNDVIQSVYLDLITDTFEKTGVKHCVMKGPVIRPLYPRPDFRQSSDLDIYVPEEQREKAFEIMKSLGFEVERYSLADADDVYNIPNKIEVELHRTLVSNKTEWQDECQKITDRLVLKEGKRYSYEMSKEDYYLYMIAHMGKHFKYTSVGIKMVLDVWVYMNAYKNSLDWELLNQRLYECGLLTLEHSFRKLVDYWFYDVEADVLTKQLSNYIVVSGNFGTQKQLDMYSMVNESKGSNNILITKFVYYWKFFFQPFKWMCNRYPMLIKVPVLLPFCWVHRALKTLLFDKDKTKQIASRYDGVDMDESVKLQEFKHHIGV